MRGVVHVGEEITLTVIRPEGPHDLVTVTPGRSTVAWFATTFCGHLPGDPDRIVERLAEGVPDGSDGVLFVPGSGGGMLVGLSDETGLEHCARAVLEGLVHTVVAQPQAPELTGLTVTGDPGDLWYRLLADVTGVAVSAGSLTVTPGPAAVRTHRALRVLHRVGTAALAGVTS